MLTVEQAKWIGVIIHAILFVYIASIIWQNRKSIKDYRIGILVLILPFIVMSTLGVFIEVKTTEIAEGVTRYFLSSLIMAIVMFTVPRGIKPVSYKEFRSIYILALSAQALALLLLAVECFGVKWFTSILIRG